MSALWRADLENAYRGKRVLLTGHTGFKGAWLTVWLSELGAQVFGLALPPDSPRGAFLAAGIEKRCRHRVSDIRDFAAVRAAVDEAKPDVVFHLAAQSLVRRSYQEPVETVQVNVIGTLNLLEALRVAGRPCAVVIVTSDKCYENRSWPHGYRENDAMGGHDIYSMSKGATELLVASYRRSFFEPSKLALHGLALATARAGNVIGGGDWAEHRIVPDVIRALHAGHPAPLRNPGSVRPWQHVLEPLGGYLLLGARLQGIGTRAPATFCEGWNFGPSNEASRPVAELAEGLIQQWGAGSWEDRSDPSAPHEAAVLRLSIDMAFAAMNWSPRWGFSQSVEKTVEWYRAQLCGAGPTALEELTLKQIAAY